MKWDRRKRMSRHRRGIAGHTSAGVRTGFQDLACTSCLLFTREKYTQMQASSSFPIQLWAKYLPPPICLPPFLLFLQSHIKNMNLQLGRNVTGWKHCLFFFWHLASLRHCSGFCLFNLLFAVQNLGGKLQNVVSLQMCWCFAFLFWKEEKESHLNVVC